MEITTLIWMFVLGASVAMCICYYNSRFLGRLVRKLIEIDATSPETALSLDELDLKMTPALKYSLRPGTSFSQTVLKTADDRYYIAPDRLSMAKTKYRGKDTTIVFLLICLLGLVVVAAALNHILPDLLNGAGAGFGELFGDGGNGR
ncbi:MAG: hypothetical protein IJY88_07370 [Clostridia bacterium]|nr:hypothetical protein [Clostridia bacterium]